MMISQLPQATIAGVAQIMDILSEVKDAKKLAAALADIQAKLTAVDDRAKQAEDAERAAAKREIAAQAAEASAADRLVAADAATAGLAVAQEGLSNYRTQLELERDQQAQSARDAQAAQHRAEAALSAQAVAVEARSKQAELAVASAYARTSDAETALAEAAAIKAEYTNKMAALKAAMKA
jgi:hypothetical protein